MIDAINSDSLTLPLDSSHYRDHTTEKVSELILKILPAILSQQIDVERIVNVLSYLALKIEDFQYGEKLSVAYRHGNVDEVLTLLSEIKQRPGGYYLLDFLSTFFEDAINDNKDAIVEFMWKEFGNSLEIENADKLLEDAIDQDNVSRAQWILENFEIDLCWNLEEFALKALDHDMLFVLEALLEKNENFNSGYVHQKIFNAFINSDRNTALDGIKLVWPIVKHNIPGYTLRKAIAQANEEHNQSMVSFLEACLEEEIPMRKNITVILN